MTIAVLMLVRTSVRVPAGFGVRVAVTVAVVDRTLTFVRISVTVLGAAAAAVTVVGRRGVDNGDGARAWTAACAALPGPADEHAAAVVRPTSTTAVRTVRRAVG